jgi:hypothetical protein
MLTKDVRDIVIKIYIIDKVVQKGKFSWVVSMFFNLYRVIHLLITGIIIIPFAWFLAEGGIGENFSGSRFTDPQMLLVIPVWILRSVLIFIKKTVKWGLLITLLPIISAVLRVSISILRTLFFSL